MLSAIHGIYDVLEITALALIVGEILYSQVCLKDLKWDEEVPEEIQGPWNKWLRAIHEQPTIMFLVVLSISL